MSARCPVCKRFIRKGAYCAVTRECRESTAREVERKREVEREREVNAALRRLGWAAHVRTRLRDLTPEQRAGIRAWVDLLASAPEGDQAECLRALDEVGE